MVECRWIRRYSALYDGCHADTIAVETGDPTAADRLLPVVYDELRQLAEAKLANEKPGQTLQATALVHEAFMRLVNQTTLQHWDSSRHFFSAAAESMRRILIERARRRASLKRGGDRERIALDAVEPSVLPLACDDILGLDESLQKLEREHPRKAELVKLRFFAMELVKGVPVTEYCDRNRLTIQERLELFIPVCQAIQHAHHKGIIRRDIKPSNVLITLHDGKPVPKVIDFGVAKSLSARLTDRTIYTEHFQIVGTLLYMSPEQAELSGLGVDTRSDVYSLGVLLYELVTGTTPFQKHELEQAGFDEQRRIIREQEPPRASVRISSLGETATTVADHRRTDVGKLNQQFRADLDGIIHRTLEKDRTRRYESPEDLAQDVGNYLAGEPVDARPPTIGYMAAKYLRRNRVPIAVCAMLILSLSLGLIGTAWQAQKAETHAADAKEKKDEAEKNAAEAKKNAAEAKRALEIVKEYTIRLGEQAKRIGLHASREGDETATQAALDVLRENPDRKSDVEVISALLAVTQGDFETARKHAKKAIDYDETNFTAQALLTKTAIHTGQDGDYPAELAKLRNLNPHEEHERLVKIVVEVFNDPKNALDLLEDLWLDTRSVLKLSIRAEARLHRAYQTGDIDLCKAGLQDLEYLEYILTPNLNISGNRILGLTYAMQLVKSQGKHEEAAEFAERAEKENLWLQSNYPDESGSPFCRWFYLFHKPDAGDAAWEAIRKVDQSSGSYALFVAVDRFKNQANPDRALEQFCTVFPEGSGDYAKLAKAILQTRLSDPTEVKVTADDLANHPTVFLRKFAIYRYCMLGDSKRMREVAESMLDGDAHFFEVLGEKDCIQAFADPESLPALIERSADSEVKRALAHFTHAMIHLAEGNRPEAKREFSKVAETQANVFFEDQFVNAFLDEMSRDTQWPRVSHLQSDSELSPAEKSTAQ